MARTGAIEATLARAGIYAARAKEALEGFAPSVVRECLMDVADYTVRRAT